jgi:hypothetical protein
MRGIKAALALALAITAAGAVAQAPATAPAAPAATTQPAAQPAIPAGAMSVYGTALGEGWANWSWGKTTLSLELNGSARRPIKAEPKGWEAVYLHHEPFSTAPYRALRFLIQGAPPGGQQISVQAIVGGKPVPEKAKTLKLASGGWTEVKVPLSQLGAADATIDGIWVQNASAEPAPAPFYVTEIYLEP